MTDEEQIAALRAERDGPINNLTETDRNNIVAHLSYELEPTGLLPNRNSIMMDWVMLKNEATTLRAKVARLEGALRKLHHAVCGETGFAACVRLDSGKAYPWPALDDADKATRAALTDGGKDG